MGPCSGWAPQRLILQTQALASSRNEEKGKVREGEPTAGVSLTCLEAPSPLPLVFSSLLVSRPSPRLKISDVLPHMNQFHLLP
jgi:hypothetical protein